MRVTRYFLLLSALTLVFCFASASYTLACACSKDCCKKEIKKTVHPKACCAQSNQTSQTNQTNQDKNCGGTCGDKGRCCPVVFSMSALPASAIFLKITYPVFSLSKKADWYYRQVLPNSVFLSIWLPPKISA